MSLNLDNKFVKLSIEKSLRDLPALPVVVTKVLQETQNPDSSASAIEKLLSSDQALASKVLRVVNSAYYGLSGQVTSLSQAIMILGMPQVRNLVLSVSAVSTMKPKTSRQQETLKLFWTHAFGTAAATQIIARKKRMQVQDGEALFLGGLLHDVGLLFLYTMFTQTYDQVLRVASDKKLPTLLAEQTLLGIGHPEIGGLMARHWKLPESLVSLIEKHEGPFTDNADPALLAIHVADNLTKDLYHPGGNHAIPPLEGHAQLWLAMTEQELDEVRRETNEKIQEASAVFGLLAA